MLYYVLSYMLYYIFILHAILHVILHVILHFILHVCFKQLTNQNHKQVINTCIVSFIRDDSFGFPQNQDVITKMKNWVREGLSSVKFIQDPSTNEAYTLRELVKLEGN